MATFAAIWNTVKAGRVQRELIQLKAGIDKMNSVETRDEERAYELRSKRVFPYLEKLQESIRQAAIVDQNIQAINALPYSNALLKTLLASTGEVQKFAALSLELSNLGPSVLVGIHIGKVNQFAADAQEVIQKQIATYNVIANASELNDSVLADFKLKYESHKEASARLFKNLREYITESSVGNVQNTGASLDPTALANWIEAGTASQISVGMPTSAPVWVALWRVALDASVTLIEFETLFTQLTDELSTRVPGVLRSAFEKGVVKGDDHKGYVAMLTFSGKNELEAFTAILPAIKSNSKLLWTEPFTPEIKQFD